jgi:hypothetical protein
VAGISSVCDRAELAALAEQFYQVLAGGVDFAIKADQVAARSGLVCILTNLFGEVEDPGMLTEVSGDIGGDDGGDRVRGTPAGGLPSGPEGPSQASHRAPHRPAQEGGAGVLAATVAVAAGR